MKFSALFTLALAALVGSVSAFTPNAGAFLRQKAIVNYGKYDDQLWDIEAKIDVYK